MNLPWSFFEKLNLKFSFIKVSIGFNRLKPEGAPFPNEPFELSSLSSFVSEFKAFDSGLALAVYTSYLDFSSMIGLLDNKLNI